MMLAEGLWNNLLFTFELALLIAILGFQVYTAAHIALYKRDSRSAVAWMVSAWFLPVIGSILYFWLGVNRLERKARSLRSHSHHPRYNLPVVEHEILPENLAEQYNDLVGIAKAIGSISGFPLVSGNHFEPLDRQRAYPEMLRAIEEAKLSITLVTYLFDDDPTGELFAEALAAATKRGVEVRVLVDDVGSKYSRPPIFVRLQSLSVPHAPFLPKFLPIPFAYSQLRNHRKIMVIDGSVGYTGGMNIRHNQAYDAGVSHPVNDLHFRVTGPIVYQLQTTFAEDWWFTTEEFLEGEKWYPKKIPLAGSSTARGIPDGPDEDLDNLRLTILSAITSAKRSLKIVTPYFLPDHDVTTALKLAALRGVIVDIVLPEKNNLLFVQWATTPFWSPLLQRGCHIWLTPPPFDHTKLLLVDGHWCMIGSANWDPRSLRLNFEFNIECYDAVLTYNLEKIVQAKLATAKPVTLEELSQRPLWVRLRDGFARLFAPFL
jgi:cardiolipin synthase A/B